MVGINPRKPRVIPCSVLRAAYCGCTKGLIFQHDLLFAGPLVRRSRVRRAVLSACRMRRTSPSRGRRSPDRSDRKRGACAHATWRRRRRAQAGRPRSIKRCRLPGRGQPRPLGCSRDDAWNRPLDDRVHTLPSGIAQRQPSTRRVRRSHAITVADLRHGAPVRPRIVRATRRSSLGERPDVSRQPLDRSTERPDASRQRLDRSTERPDASRQRLERSTERPDASRPRLDRSPKDPMPRDNGSIARPKDPMPRDSDPIARPRGPMPRDGGSIA